MFRAVTWLSAGGPLQPGPGWRRHGRFGAPGRLHFLMAIAALAVYLLPASVAHAQGASPTVSTVAITSDPGTGGIHTPSHEHTSAPSLTSPDKNNKGKP